MQDLNSLSQSDRKAAIDGLISQLTDWERLRLRSELRKVPLKFADLPDLPQEAICQIIPYLTLGDVASCRLVSRAWRSAWTNSAVVIDLCDAFFPGVLELQPSASPAETFMRAAMNRLRLRYKPFEPKVIAWDPSWSSPVFTNGRQCNPAYAGPLKTVEASLPVAYSNGKVAWQPSRNMFIIDDLKTRTRRRIGLGPGKLSAASLTLEGVSDNLLIAAGMGGTGLPNTLFINHLETGAWGHLTLPNRIVKGYVEGGRIGAVTSLGNIAICRPGHPVTQVETRNTPNELDFRPDQAGYSGRPGLILHPSQHDAFYCVWMGMNPREEEAAFTLLVAKFKNSKRVWHTKKSIVCPLRPPKRACSSGSYLSLSLSCEKANAYGSYTLCAYRFVERDTVCECRFRDWDPRDFGAVLLNTVADTITVHSYKVPDHVDTSAEFGTEVRENISNRPLHDVSVWNNTLFLSSHIGKAGEGGVDDHSITLEAFPPAQGSWAPAMQLKAKIQLHPTCYETAGMGQLFADDEFLLLRTRNGLVVWNRLDATAGGERGSEIQQPITMEAAQDSKNKYTPVQYRCYTSTTENGRVAIVRMPDPTQAQPSQPSQTLQDVQDENREADMPPDLADLIAPAAGGLSVYSRWPQVSNFPLLHSPGPV